MELTAPHKTQIRAIASNKNYLRLLSAQVVSAFGDRIHQMALLNFIIAVSNSSNTTKHIADITFCGILPAVLLGPFALALVDRWPWKKTMLFSTSARGLLAFGMPLILATWYNVHAVWITAFLLGMFAAVFAPARLAIMPNLVQKKELTTTNAISSQIGTVATIAGVPLGGYLVNVLGRNTGFVVDGLAFLAAAILIVSLKPAARASLPREDHSASRVREDFLEGLRYLRAHLHVRFMLLFFGFLTLVSGIFYVCLFSYSIEILHLEERGTGQLFGVLGLGMAGAAVLLVARPRLGDATWLPYAALAGCGALIWRMSQGGSSHFVALLLFGVGFCGILSLVPNDTYLQHHVPDRVRGRVFVVRGVLQGIAWLFSLQLVKSLVFHMGLAWVLAWLGIGTVVMAVLFWSISTTQIVRNQRLA